jgi:hypothetical protein
MVHPAACTRAFEPEVDSSFEPEVVQVRFKQVRIQDPASFEDGMNSVDTMAKRGEENESVGINLSDFPIKSVDELFAESLAEAEAARAG